jgi:hypothetical protein
MAIKDEKVVFVMGAGFSFPALQFGQAKILEKLDELAQTNDAIKKLTRSSFRFIKDVFGGRTTVSLEDVYTALDRSILESQSLKSYVHADLVRIRQGLSESVTELTRMSVQSNKNTAYVESFAEKACRFRRKAFDERKRFKDPKRKKYGLDRIAIVSLNWDTILDAALANHMSKYYRREKRKISPGDMFIDYCMFDFKIKKNSIVPPSLRMKPLDIVNFKLLKLHGSMHWFRCSNCAALYVNLETKPYETLVKHQKYCHVCLRFLKKVPIDPKNLEPYELKRYFVTPTLLKDFNSTHFRSIWWNAGYEIAEATRIIFIGYSLPLADYDFKFLIAKHLDKNAKIEVVLSNSATDFEESCRNYRDFFGDRISDKSIHCQGAEQYAKDLDFETIYL